MVVPFGKKAGSLPAAVRWVSSACLFVGVFGGRSGWRGGIEGFGAEFPRGWEQLRSWVTTSIETLVSETLFSSQVFRGTRLVEDEHSRGLGPGWCCIFLGLERPLLLQICLGFPFPSYFEF